MTFEIWKNSTQLAQLIVLVVITPMGIALTGLRFLVVYRARRKPHLEEWLTLAATIGFVMTNLCGLMAISILNGRQIVDEIAESPSDYSRMRQWDMGGLYSYFVHSLFVKLAVLKLYERLFGVYRAYRIWIYLLAVFQTVLFALMCIFQALQCQPLAKYFDISVPGTCKDEGSVILMGETPNSLVDYAMVILAMQMIRPRKLPPNVKVKLRLLFGLGFIVGTLGFIKIAVTYSTSDIYALSLIAVLTGVQMFASLICCCLPVIHTLLPNTGFWEWVSLSTTRGSHPAASWPSGFETKAASSQHSSKRSAGGSNYAEQNARFADWDSSHDNSAKNLTLPEPAHWEHALSDYSGSTYRHGPPLSGSCSRDGLWQEEVA